MEHKEYKTENLMDLDDKQSEVYRLLLMNIEPINRLNKKPYIDSDIINSGEIYIPQNSKNNGCLDADMSDIAILFYETVYDSITILKKKRIELFDENVRTNTEIRRPNDLNFMGDTMITTFKEFKYHHCLANFWVLPFKIGRTLDPEFGRGVRTKLNDRIEDFLGDLEKRNKQYSESFESYFEEFKIGNDFYKKHFLIDSFVKNKEIAAIKSKSDAETAIRNRASMISKEKGKELYDLFLKLDMVGAK